MRVDVLVPDAPALPHGPQAESSRANPFGVGSDPPATFGRSAGDAAGAFGKLVDAAGAILAGADRAEAAFASHRGGLQEMVVERARADIALQIAATAAQRTAQSLSTLLGMQI
jgi:hypothetical protein